MTTPDVSVIIPNYNRHQSLERAVDSVLCQEGVRWELLLIDDASDQPPEATYRRLEQAGHRVLRAPRRQGPGPCRNWGAREARGSYLAFLDSDDAWRPGKLDRQLDSLRASGRRVGQTEEIWIRHGVRVNPLQAHRIEGGDLYARSLRAVCISPSSILLERTLFWELGGFDPELYVCEDYDLWLRLAAREHLDVVQEPLVVKYGGHSDQLSRALPSMDRFRLRALVKGLHGGAFAPREAMACQELHRKAEILSQGAAKRGHQRAVQLCRELRQATDQADWDSALALSAELMALWPLSPADSVQ